MRYTNDWAAWITAGMLLVTPMAATGSQIEGAGPSDRVEANPTELEAEARELFASPTRYDEAVRLFVKAAELRGVGDQQRVKDFVMASRLTYYRGGVAEALSLMQRAANEALSTGDVLAAAHGFMDSAYLAQEAGEAGVATEMIRKAERLTYSPLLAREDREELRSRISAGA
jgi:ATP/maltotriose-dependent transcriptional regulator MalT